MTRLGAIHPHSAGAKGSAKPGKHIDSASLKRISSGAFVFPIRRCYALLPCIEKRSFCAVKVIALAVFRAPNALHHTLRHGNCACLARS